MTGADVRVVFVGGLSGSGKSTAMAALEDLSFYGADNLPPQLIQQFLALCGKADPPIRNIALAIDAREAEFLRLLPQVVTELRESGSHVELIFLDCEDEALVSRYRETRRVHPLSPTGSVEEGIERERRLLADVSQLADIRIDTSSMNVHQLRETVSQRIAGQTRQTTVRLVSFGFRYGTPPAAETLFDVRFLPNPYFEAELRAGTGLDAPVAAHVMDSPSGQAFMERLSDLIAFLLPLYDREGKAYLRIGIGCTGGRHRSVAIAEALAAELRTQGRQVTVDHRDVGREPAGTVGRPREGSAQAAELDAERASRGGGS